MIGLQSSLDRILATLQNPPQLQTPHTPHTPTYANGTPPFSAPSSGTFAGLSRHSGSSATGVSPDASSHPPGPSSRTPTSQGRHLHPLPGVAPHRNKHATHVFAPSNPPSDDESEDALSRATIDPAPVQAQQRLSNAAAGYEASAVPAVSLGYAPQPFYRILTHSTLGTEPPV
jgi:hypothetical protein